MRDIAVEEILVLSLGSGDLDLFSRSNVRMETHCGAVCDVLAGVASGVEESSEFTVAVVLLTGVGIGGKASNVGPVVLKVL